MTPDRLISEDSSRRALLGLLLPAAAGLVLPVRLAVARTPDGSLAAIPYADLPTGAGSWNTGGGLITIANALTVSGNLTAAGKAMVGTNGAVGSDSTLVAVSNGSTSDLYVVRSLPGFPSTTTGTGICFNAQVGTVASAFTMGAGIGLLVFDAAKGAGSSITTLYGLYIANQSQGATNYAIYTNTGQVRFGDLVSIDGGSGLIFSGGTVTARMNPNGSTNFYLTTTSAHPLVLGYNTFAKAVVLDSASWSPSSAASLTLGSTSLPWGTVYVATDIDFRSTGGSRRCGWSATAADTLKWYDSGANNRLVVKYADGHPIIGLETENAQLAVGDPTNGGYVLLNGTNNGGGEAGDVLITGRSGGSAGVGDVKIRTSADGSSATTLATFKADGALNVGSPSISITGAGKINLAAAGDIYKNGTAYANPDYVFELAYEGAARSPAPACYTLHTLEETERFTREHLHLPGISRAASGMFARADMLLEKVEELHLHAFAQQRQNLALQSDLIAQRCQIESLEVRVQQLESENQLLVARC